MEIPEEFWEAAEDLRYLLNRGYPREGSLQAVGNRYNLPQDLRHLLRRGVFAVQDAEARKRKMVSVEELRGEKLAIDGYNVLITLESALGGRPILLADNGFVRDIAGVSGSYREGAATTEALNLIFDLLKAAGPPEAVFLFDSPISASREHATPLDRKSGGEGKREDHRGRRTIQKKKGEERGH